MRRTGYGQLIAAKAWDHLTVTNAIPYRRNSGAEADALSPRIRWINVPVAASVARTIR